MVKELITKKGDGSYGFTNDGQFTAYSFTMRNLLQHYLQAGMKMPAPEAKQKLAGFSQFIDNNLHTIDDFLDKLPELAGFIGENDTGRFGGFIGQHFLSSLEKIKMQLMERELPKAKERYDNPYRSPGNELLDQFAEMFAKAPPMNGGSNGGAAAASGAMAPDAGNTAVEDTTGSPAAVAIEDKEAAGVRLLEQFGAAFQAAPPFDFDAAAFAAAPASAEEGTATLADVIKDDEPNVLPGEKVLERFGNEFMSAPPLQLSDEEPGGEAAKPVSSLPQQITFREYAQIVSSVSKFTRNKDNAGYQQWYGALKPEYRTAVNINNLVGRELKGQPVNWVNETSEMSTRFILSSDVIGKLREEVLAYRRILVSLQGELKKASASSGDAASINKLYPQLVGLFENKDTIADKKTQLKMMLLQVTHAETKQLLLVDLSQMLDKLKDLYHLD